MKLQKSILATFGHALFASALLSGCSSNKVAVFYADFDGATLNTAPPAAPPGAPAEDSILIINGDATIVSEAGSRGLRVRGVSSYAETRLKSDTSLGDFTKFRVLWTGIPHIGRGAFTAGVSTTASVPTGGNNTASPQFLSLHFIDGQVRDQTGTVYGSYEDGVAKTVVVNVDVAKQEFQVTLIPGEVSAWQPWNVPNDGRFDSIVSSPGLDVSLRVRDFSLQSYTVDILSVRGYS